MKNKHLSLLSLLLVTVCILSSCKKFLDEKPRKSYQVPERLSDFQAMLDFYPAMNNKEILEMEISADDYYLTDETYNGLTQVSDRRLYTWEKEQVFPLLSNNWLDTYYTIYNANSVLDGIGNLDPESDLSTYNNVKGQALLFRGKSFLQLACAFSPAYDPTTQNTDQGIVLRLSSDFNIQLGRASVEVSFAQIIQDFKAALSLLPNNQITVMRPSKPAAFAYLARTFLYMRKYNDAEKYADSCLLINNKLIDFNTLNSAATYPISRMSPEVLFENYANAAPLLQSRARISQTLYDSYTANDLRKAVFFKNNNNGSYAFKGSYEGGSQLFTGPSTNEIYLIRAEARARNGNIVGAMNDLNTLLVKRFKSGTFSPKNATDKENAIQIILKERRKELLFRNLRWADIKRLNKEGENIILTKIVNGKSYSLYPNDLRYALALPEDLVNTWGLQQNAR